MTQLTELPYTITFVIRKRQQLDNLLELPKEKQPPTKLIWEGSSEDLEDWINRVVLKNEPQNFEFTISEDDIG